MEPILISFREMNGIEYTSTIPIAANESRAETVSVPATQQTPARRSAKPLPPKSRDHQQPPPSPSHLPIYTMICRICLRAASRAYPPPTSLSLAARLSTSTPRLTPVTATPIPGAQQPPPPATSSSAAQPFSEASTPAPKKDAAPPAAEKKVPIVRSSVPAGTPLKGLNFLKDKPDPVALPDEEYPEWLWGILERQEKKGETGSAGDLFCMSLPPFLTRTRTHTHTHTCPTHTLLVLSICLSIAVANAC